LTKLKFTALLKSKALKLETIGMAEKLLSVCEVPLPLFSTFINGKHGPEIAMKSQAQNTLLTLVFF